MELRTILSGRYPRYHSEFRILFTSTSADPAPERELLFNTVLPEVRREARERGVLVVEHDPRLEASMAPGRAEEIAAARLDELNGYRPVFIGVLGTPGGTSRGDMPWLRDMGDGEGSRLGMKFIESAMENPLLRERSFFYIPKSLQQTGENGPLAERVEGLRAIARNGEFALRDTIADAEELGRLMRADLLAMLDRFHPAGEHLSLLERLRRSHETFAAPLRRGYLELPGHFDHLDRHVTGDAPALFITGVSGAGKSALVANWTAYHRKTDSQLPVICHHVGALAVESGHASIIRHILMELKELFAINEAVPESIAELAPTLPLWLEQGGGRRVVLVIDGLDHLDPASHSLDWLPADIPPNIRLILTTTHNEQNSREIYHHLIDREWSEYLLPALTLEQQRAVIRKMANDSTSDLDPDVLGRFTLGGAVSNPLFLRMGVRQLQKTRGSGDRDRLLATRTQEEFFTTMFEQLEQAHGSVLVGEVMSYIWGSRAEIHEMELRALTGTDDESLKPLLAATDHYLASHEQRIRFLHPHVRKAVEERYLPKPAAQRKVHKALADYFASQPPPISLHRAEEEPWQWRHAGERKRLAECLADIGMFELLSTEEHWPTLREYWVWINDESLLISSYNSSFAAWCARTPDIAEQARMADRLGVFFMMSGLLEPSEHYLRRALKLEQEYHGNDSITTARVLHHLAELLRQRGVFAEAEERYRAALAILEQHPGISPLPIAQVLSDIGLLYRDSGQHQRALPYYKRAVELKEQACGADHPSTAESLNDLALLYHDLREFEMAIPLYRRAQQIRERRLGPNHPATATSFNNLGGAYRDAGNIEEAERLYSRALAIREKMLGFDHPNTLITLSNIASLLNAQGDLDASRTLLERAIISTTERLGKEHPNLIPLRTSYAYLLRDLGSHTEAEQQLRQNLTLAQQTLGNHHPNMATCANNLAVMLRKMNRNDEAAPFYKQAITAWEHSLGSNHPYIADALESLGNIHFLQGKMEAAAEDIERSLAIRMKFLGEDHLLTKRLMKLQEKIRQQI